ncbi:MAG: hypothetical protein J0M04_17415 [Verrucomicrobia bacterium]|nr:hypothetical protein [Verrucomicrobiota bacterium]
MKDRNRGTPDFEFRRSSGPRFVPFDIRNSAFAIPSLAAWKSASHTVKPEKRLQPPVKPTPPAP